jgi:DGQHR domain-containing protein
MANTTNWSYSAFSIQQQTDTSPTLVIFTAKVSEIQKWASVKALGPKSWGPQREGKEARVEAIENFLRSDPINTIPTAIIVAFEPGLARFNNGILEIDDNAGAATIVDGQHRLMGMSQFNPEIEAPIVGLLDTSEVEQAFQFLIINNKSSKVPVTHLKALLASKRGTDLDARLKKARIAFNAQGITDVDLVNSIPDSPFFEKIDWTITTQNDRWVQATAIEQSLDYIGELGIPELTDRDITRSVFLKIWTTIKDHFPKLWVKDSRLISKVNIMSLTRFIIDLITSWADNEDVDIEITDLNQIATQTQKIIKHMDSSFWTTDWAEKARGGFDTAQGRDRYHAALVQLYRNGRRGLPWYTDIEIIDRATAKE